MVPIEYWRSGGDGSSCFSTVNFSNSWEKHKVRAVFRVGLPGCDVLMTMWMSLGQGDFF